MLNKLVLLFFVLYKSTKSLDDEIADNIDSILHDSKPIGKGCSSTVNEKKFKDLDLAIKVYFDQERCKNEINFILGIKDINPLPILKYYHLNTDRKVMVMDKAEKNLEKALEEVEYNTKHLKKLVNKLFKGLFQLHRNQIIHSDLRLYNIMLKDNEIYFIDFDQSYISTDFTIDLFRLKYFVLCYIKNWENLINNNLEPFIVIEKIYSSWKIRWLFNFAKLFPAPSVQRKVINLFYHFTKLGQFNEEYYKSIAA